MTDQIKLVQYPIITHKLIEVGKEVTKRLDELNIEKLVASNESLKSLKKLRAELNNELKDFETSRKDIKTKIFGPYNEFEDVYKSEIQTKYGKAIDTLKDKIASVEDKILSEKKEKVELYFTELCQVEGIDFIKFDDIDIEINLSITEKAYQDRCNKFVLKVKDDLDLINKMEFQVEIMAEYKKSLNVSDAIRTINDRKERERQELERQKQIEWHRRVEVLRSMKMPMDEETNTFIYNDDIYVSISIVKELSKNDFATKVIELEEKINALRKLVRDQGVMTFGAPVVKQEEPVKESEKVNQGELEIVTASFEVKGTLPQLKALGAYMKENNLTYKNI